MSNYLIKLKPTGKYFFGGDMTFSVGKTSRKKNDKKLTAKEEKQIKYNTQYSSYIINSEKFPQQTSLLGMLRFLLLRNNPKVFDGNKIIGDKGIVSNLIGKNSFRANDGEINEFGKIKELSPCFLLREFEQDNKLVSRMVTRLPMDYGFEKVVLSKNNNLSYNDNNINLGTITRKDEKGEPKPYSAKDGISTRYGHNDGTIFDENEIFIEDQRIGISRNIETGKTEDDALFKQVNYRLADEFCFAFYAMIEMDITPYSNQIVSLGADSSQFVIQITNMDDADVLPHVALPVSNVPTEGCCGKIVLTSPSIIDVEKAKLPDFAMAETIPFKYMKTEISRTTSYHRLSGIEHSEKEELFQTGSVFYFKSQENCINFKKELDKRIDFRQIGYNYYQEYTFILTT